MMSNSEGCWLTSRNLFTVRNRAPEFTVESKLTEHPN